MSTQGLNQVTLIGFLGRDPAKNQTSEGSQVTNFSLAVTERWKDREGEPKEHTEWFRIVCWDNRGQACAEFLSKGRRAFVQGRQRTRTYTDADGQERSITGVIASNVIFLDPPKQSNGKEAKKGPSPGKPAARPAPKAPRDPEFDQRIEEDPFA